MLLVSFLHFVFAWTGYHIYPNIRSELFSNSLSENW